MERQSHIPELFSLPTNKETETNLRQRCVHLSLPKSNFVKIIPNSLTMASTSNKQWYQTLKKTRFYYFSSVSVTR